MERVSASYEVITVKIKAYCDKEKIEELLDGRPVKWLGERLNEMGIKIEYPALLANMNNKVEWKLTYAMGIAKLFNTTIEKLFILK